jgi:hypothetical protein
MSIIIILLIFWFFYTGGYIEVKFGDHKDKSDT